MNYLEQHGRTLVENGYRIVPILAGTKAPDAGKGWQNVTATAETVDRWLSEGRGPGVGVLTRDTPAVDLDLSHQPTIDALQSWCDEHIGRTPHRIGRPPRRLLVFRTDTPFAKKRLEFRTETGEKQLVEVLGNGQQFVAFATHPDTKMPYAWPAGSLAEIHVDFLPTITETLADKLLAYFESVAPDTWEIVSRSSKPNEKPTGINLAAPLDRVAAALDVLPNDERHYDEWIRIGHAIKAATNDSWEGRELFHDWSRKADKYDYRETERAWDSIHEAKHIGAGTIFREAMQHGFQMPPTPAAADFEPVDIHVMPSAALQRQFDVQVAEWEAGAATISPDGLTAEQRRRIADDVSRKLLSVARDAARIARRPYQSVTAADAAANALRAGADPLVRGLIGQNALAVIFGRPNCGKSFLALDIGASVSAGEPWNGRDTAAGVVLYIAAEGGNGINARMAALMRKATGGLPRLHLIAEPVDFFSSTADVEGVASEARHLAAVDQMPVRLIVVDTLARAMASGDENSGKDMGQFIANLDRLRNATGATVLVVHHSGKDASRGSRGHSSLLGAIDTEMEIADRQIRITKQRDFEILPNPIRFELVTVTLGRTEKGEDVTSCFVRYPGAHEFDFVDLSAPAQRMYDALVSAHQKAGAPVSVAAWEAEYTSAAGGPSGAKPRGVSAERQRALRREVLKSGIAIEVTTGCFEPFRSK